MSAKRAIAVSIVAVLLAVTSMAAACDLSCAFGVAEADCHARGRSALDAVASAMDMSGMDMAGMAIPTTDGANPSSAPDVSRAIAAHPSIGDMGPCERQSCDRNSFVATRATRFSGARVFSILPVAYGAAGSATAQAFHGARDDVAPPTPSQVRPLTLVRRI